MIGLREKAESPFEVNVEGRDVVYAICVCGADFGGSVSETIAHDLDLARTIGMDWVDLDELAWNDTYFELEGIEGMRHAAAGLSRDRWGLCSRWDEAMSVAMEVAREGTGILDDDAWADVVTRVYVFMVELSSMAESDEVVLGDFNLNALLASIDAPWDATVRFIAKLVDGVVQIEPVVDVGAIVSLAGKA